MLFLVIARFARRHDVAFGAFAAAHDRDNVVHGELARRDLVAAVVALTGRSPPLPPLRLAQLLGFLTLAPDLFFADLGDETFGAHPLAT